MTGSHGDAGTRYALLGVVNLSSSASQRNASSALRPHISSFGRSRTQTAGRLGSPKIRQRLSGVS
jgi:hypothetical protein